MKVDASAITARLRIVLLTLILASIRVTASSDEQTTEPETSREMRMNELEARIVESGAGSLQCEDWIELANLHVSVDGSLSRSLYAADYATSTCSELRDVYLLKAGLYARLEDYANASANYALYHALFPAPPHAVARAATIPDPNCSIDGLEVGLYQDLVTVDLPAQDWTRVEQKAGALICRGLRHPDLYLLRGRARAKRAQSSAALGLAWDDYKTAATFSSAQLVQLVEKAEFEGGQLAASTYQPYAGSVESAVTTYRIAILRLAREQQKDDSITSQPSSFPPEWRLRMTQHMKRLATVSPYDHQTTISGQLHLCLRDIDARMRLVPASAALYGLRAQVALELGQPFRARGDAMRAWKIAGKAKFEEKSTQELIRGVLGYYGPADSKTHIVLRALPDPH